MSAYTRFVRGASRLPSRVVCYEVRCAEFATDPVTVCDESGVRALEAARGAIIRMAERGCHRIRVERHDVSIEIGVPGGAGTTDG